MSLLLASVAFLAGISLNGEWTLDCWPQPETAAVRVPQPPKGARRVPAQVPGTCEMELVRAGILPEPEVGLNAAAFRPYEGYQWLYSRTFDAPALKDGARAVLVFEGIDTLSDVFLNGEKIGETHNMLIPWRFDVTDRLKPGENRVQVLIRSVMLEARHETIGELSRRHASLNGDGEMFRKAAHMGGWDIFPRLYTSGLWRDVSLEIEPFEKIDQVAWMTAEVADDGHRASVAVSCRVRAPFASYLKSKLVYTLARHGREVFRQVRPLTGSQQLLDAHEIRNVDLWWPRGWGESALYEATVALVSEDGRELAADRRRIGFRRIELEYADNYGPEKPGQFLFRVNGRPCYIRGTNWVPLDAIHSRDMQHLASTLALVKDLNCNMIRVWGGGVYEPEAFFDWCDAHGVMVWQDFMTGCIPYPQNDRFAALMREEVLDVVLRFRNRPSLALWSGNNEIDWSFSWCIGDKSKRRNPNDDRNSRRTIPEVLFEFDTTRDYLPSSPYWSPAVARGEARPSEEHLWGARGYYKVDEYTNAPCHFASEMGYHGCPNVASLKRMMTPGAVFPWENPETADWRDLGWNREWQLKATNPYDTPGHYAHPDRNALMTKQCALLFGTCPRTLEDFVDASQIVQSEALKTFIELFRSRKFTRMNGLIWWNVRDGWPIISDAVVDYYGGKKRAYETIRLCQADQLVCVTDDGRVHAINDTLAPVTGRVRVTDRESGRVLLEKTYDVPANAAMVVGTVAWRGQGLLDIVFAQGGTTAKNWFLYGEKPFDLAKVRNWLKREE